MENHPQSFDVCIICALPEEVRAFLAVVKPHCKNGLKEYTSPRYEYSYRSVSLKNDKDEPLNLHISWPPRYGLQEMTLHLTYVLEECQPRIAIMTGICAGDSQQVHLGDLVVAERTFTYDNGKFVLDEHGRSVHLHNTLTYQLDPNILQFLGLFDGWKPLVARLEGPPSMPNQHEVVCHIKAMASGNAVRADNPFEDVQAPVRGTAAIDMEGAAVGLVMSRYPLTRWLIVKGVCDYADRDKSDVYHDYAASASALYALSFIRAYVTNERLRRPAFSHTAMPLQNSVPQPPQAANPLHRPAIPPPMPPPKQPKHLLVFALILLILILVGGGIIYGVATGHLPWNASHGQPTSILSGNSDQPNTNTTAAARGNATSTAQASARILGKMWHIQNSGTSQALYGVAWSGSQFVVVGKSGTILTSSDGHNWTAQPSGTINLLFRVIWSDSQFVAVGEDGTVLTSPDGHTWTSQPSGTSQILFGVAWSGSQFVAIGDNDTNSTILTSPNGHAWIAENSGTSPILLGVIWSDSQFVTVGYGGIILTSPDGHTWTSQPSGISQILYGVAWSGSQFVVVGKSGTILTSSDGHNWTAQPSGTSEDLLGVTWSGSQFVVVGNNGTILTSPDGRSWTVQNSGTLQLFYSVAWLDSHFVAVGNSGTILTSP